MNVNPDAMIVCMIDDLTTQQVRDVLHSAGIPYEEHETVAELRAFIRREYLRGELSGIWIVQAWND